MSDSVPGVTIPNGKKGLRTTSNYILSLKLQHLEKSMGLHALVKFEGFFAIYLSIRQSNTIYFKGCKTRKKDSIIKTILYKYVPTTKIIVNNKFLGNTS